MNVLNILQKTLRTYHVKFILYYNLYLRIDKNGRLNMVFLSLSGFALHFIKQLFLFVLIRFIFKCGWL